MSQLTICLIISALTVFSYAWGKLKMGTTALLSMVVFGLMAPMLAASCAVLNVKPSKVMFPLMLICISTISVLPLGSGATQFAELNGYLIGLVFFIVPFLLTQVMMNRSVITIFVPIAILACKAMEVNPVGIMILVQSACLSSFMTPMATPAVPMCMATGVVTTEMVKTMNRDAIIFACANPTPEIYPEDAKAGGAAVIATGRSDFPNQINNVLVFPGVLRRHSRHKDLPMSKVRPVLLQPVLAAPL